MDEDSPSQKHQKCGSAGYGLIFPQLHRKSEKRRAARGWRCFSKAAAAAKADWVLNAGGMIQIWSGVFCTGGLLGDERLHGGAD